MNKNMKHAVRDHLAIERTKRAGKHSRIPGIRRISKTLVLALVSLWILPLYGQMDLFPGYIIDSSHDTIHGFIDSGSPVANASYCLFRKRKNAEIVRYTPSELAGYRFENGKNYISCDISYQLNAEKMGEINAIETDRTFGVAHIEEIRKKTTHPVPEDTVAAGIQRKKVFLEFLIKGRVDIYVYYDPLGDPHYFSKKENGDIVELANTRGIVYNQYRDDFYLEKKEYRSQLQQMLSDCDGIDKKISNTTLENRSLIDLAKYYHDQTCSEADGECIIYEKTNLKTHVRITPVMGYGSMKVSASEISQAFEQNYIINGMLSYGILFCFSNFQYINDNISLQAGLVFQQQHLESDDLVTSMDFNVLNIPLGVGYSFLLHSRFQPSVGLAVCPNIRLGADIDSEYPHSRYKIKTAPVSFSGQIGFDFKLTRRWILMSRLQYYFGRAFYSADFDKSHYQEIRLQLGVGYAIGRHQVKYTSNKPGNP